MTLWLVLILCYVIFLRFLYIPHKYFGEICLKMSKRDPKQAIHAQSIYMETGAGV